MCLVVSGKHTHTVEARVERKRGERGGQETGHLQQRSPREGEGG